MFKLLKKGFTLIELLIVIAIIGILTAIVTTNLQSARERARDVRRKSDLHAIAQSLRLYYNDNNSYPDPADIQWGQPFSAASSIYMNTLPYDPSSAPDNIITYTYTSPDSDSFILSANLENGSDQDIAESQTRCSSGTGNVYVVCQ